MRTLPSALLDAAAGSRVDTFAAARRARRRETQVRRLVIAHRLSTVQIADRVLVMAGGRIVEDGTPADLMARRGQFTRLHRAWLGSNSPAPAGKPGRS